MKKTIYSLFVVAITICALLSCGSSAPSTPDKCVLEYYEDIIKNNPKCLDLMAVRFVGGTEKQRLKINAELDKQIEKNNGDLSATFFPYNGKLTKVEIVPNEEGKNYTETKSRMLPDAEAAKVIVNLTFDDGKTLKQGNVAVKVDGAWKIYKSAFNNK